MRRNDDRWSYFFRKCTSPEDFVYYLVDVSGDKVNTGTIINSYSKTVEKHHVPAKFRPSVLLKGVIDRQVGDELDRLEHKLTRDIQKYWSMLAKGGYLLQKHKRRNRFIVQAIQSVSSLTNVKEYDVIPESIFATIKEYTSQNATPVTLRTLMLQKRQGGGPRDLLVNGDGRHQAGIATLVEAANFVRKELPVRLAHRIMDLEQVPLMREMPSVQLVKRIYTTSFLDLLEQKEIKSPSDEKEFAKFLDEKYQEHANILIHMALGAYELKDAIRTGKIQGSLQGQSLKFEQYDECHAFLDRFYMSRIGIRVLAGQYMALRADGLPNYIGMVCQKTSPAELVRKAADDATIICIRRYGIAPEVKIMGRLDLTFPYIPTYLHYILLELLKNALRATVEEHSKSASFPAVTVIIADGTENEDVIIKVTDEGGGIKRSQIDTIWSYLFTTADPSVQEDLVGEVDHSNSSPMAGLGFGLPISRSYARFFGGELQIMSMEGYGTDAFVYLARLGDPASTPVPL